MVDVEQIINFLESNLPLPNGKDENSGITRRDESINIEVLIKLVEFADELPETDHERLIDEVSSRLEPYEYGPGYVLDQRKRVLTAFFTRAMKGAFFSDETADVLQRSYSPKELTEIFLPCVMNKHLAIMLARQAARMSSEIVRGDFDFVFDMQCSELADLSLIERIDFANRFTNDFILAIVLDHKDPRNSKRLFVELFGESLANSAETFTDIIECLGGYYSDVYPGVDAIVASLDRALELDSPVLPRADFGKTGE